MAADRFRFGLLTRITLKDGEEIDLWSARDALVLKALAIVLARPLPVPRPRPHVKGQGGARGGARAGGGGGSAEVAHSAGGQPRPRQRAARPDAGEGVAPARPAGNRQEPEEASGIPDAPRRRRYIANCCRNAAFSSTRSRLRRNQPNSTVTQGRMYACIPALPVEGGSFAPFQRRSNQADPILWSHKRRAADGAAPLDGDDASTELRRLDGRPLPRGPRPEVREEGTFRQAMKPNLPLASVYREQLEALGLAETPHPPAAHIGSSDITHVARVVPTIHPNFPIGKDLQLHTRAFAEAAAGPQGEAGLLEAARALALTIYTLARSPQRRREVAAAAG